MIETTPPTLADLYNALDQANGQIHEANVRIAILQTQRNEAHDASVAAMVQTNKTMVALEAAHEAVRNINSNLLELDGQYNILHSENAELRFQLNTLAEQLAVKPVSQRKRKKDGPS